MLINKPQKNKMTKKDINWEDWEEVEEFDEGEEYIELVVHRIDGTIKRRILKRKIKRQALNVSVNELIELADDLERQTRQFNLELGEKDVVGPDKKWLINIINKKPECSDTWEIEK